MRRIQEALEVLQQTFGKVKCNSCEEKISFFKNQFENCLVLPNQFLYIVYFNPFRIIYARNLRKYVDLSGEYPSLEELMGSIHEADREFFVKTIQSAFHWMHLHPGRNENLIFSTELRMLKKGKETIVIQFNARILEFDEKNYPMFVLSIGTDISHFYKGPFKPRAVLANLLTKEQFLYITKDVTMDYAISAREMEVLNLLCKGMTSKEIAGQLFISHHTVDGHRRKLLEKTKLGSTAELVSFALRHQVAGDEQSAFPF